MGEREFISIVMELTRIYSQDCGQGEWIGKDGGGNHWCDPFKSWATMYSYVCEPLTRSRWLITEFRFNPYANVTEAQKKLVLGGELLATCSFCYSPA
jgi:hypothetical protein